jgi:signal transduction histidine kinase
VNVIYEASRLDFDLQYLQMSSVLLDVAIAEAIDMLTAEAIQQQRLLQVDVPEGVTVLGSTRHMREVVFNLVSNAFKYSPVGTPVTITVSLQDEFVTIAVQDQGLGVPPEAQQLLFERFVRLERDLNSPIRGAGLGLAVCKQFTEAMGGHIWLESTGLPGEGSTFYFTLKRTFNHSISDGQPIEATEGSKASKR